MWVCFHFVYSRHEGARDAYSWGIYKFITQHRKTRQKYCVSSQRVLENGQKYLYIILEWFLQNIVRYFKIEQTDYKTQLIYHVLSLFIAYLAIFSCLSHFQLHHRLFMVTCHYDGVHCNQWLGPPNNYVKAFLVIFCPH